MNKTQSIPFPHKRSVHFSGLLQNGKEGINKNVAPPFILRAHIMRRQ
jgi:hypothetical protein